MRFHATREPFRGVIALSIAIKRDGGEIAVAQPLTFNEIPVGAMINNCMALTEDAAQELMDELWRCGVRPSDGSGSTGQLKATQDHLADMRTPTFDVVGRMLKGRQ